MNRTGDSDKRVSAGEPQDKGPLGDPALLKRFRDGDRSVLGQVYKTYAPLLARFLKGGFSFQSQGRWLRFAGLSSPADLEVALQEIFARALNRRARGAYDGLRPYEAYLIGIAKNYCLDLGRAQKAEEHGICALASEASNVAAAEQEQAVEATEIDELLRAFVEALSTFERTVFERCLCAQEKQVHVAQDLGCNRLRVWRAALRLKKELRTYLDESGYLLQTRQLCGARPGGEETY